VEELVHPCRAVTLAEFSGVPVLKILSEILGASIGILDFILKLCITTAL
jgi:hypothetical protein